MTVKKKSFMTFEITQRSKITPNLPPYSKIRTPTERWGFIALCLYTLSKGHFPIGQSLWNRKEATLSRFPLKQLNVCLHQLLADSYLGRLMSR